MWMYLSALSTSVSQSIRDMLADDTMLGRLEISLVDGLDTQGNIVNLTTFGGRSISLFRYTLTFCIKDTMFRSLCIGNNIFFFGKLF